MCANHDRAGCGVPLQPFSSLLCQANRDEEGRRRRRAGHGRHRESTGDPESSQRYPSPTHHHLPRFPHPVTYPRSLIPPTSRTILTFAHRTLTPSPSPLLSHRSASPSSSPPPSNPPSSASTRPPTGSSPAPTSASASQRPQTTHLRPLLRPHHPSPSSSIVTLALL